LNAKSLRGEFPFRFLNWETNDQADPLVSGDELGGVHYQGHQVARRSHSEDDSGIAQHPTTSDGAKEVRGSEKPH
jgi:hypothetical protein